MEDDTAPEVRLRNEPFDPAKHLYHPLFVSSKRPPANRNVRFAHSGESYFRRGGADTGRFYYPEFGDIKPDGDIINQQSELEEYRATWVGNVAGRGVPTRTGNAMNWLAAADFARSLKCVPADPPCEKDWWLVHKKHVVSTGHKFGAAVYDALAVCVEVIVVCTKMEWAWVDPETDPRFGLLDPFMMGGSGSDTGSCFQEELRAPSRSSCMGAERRRSSGGALVDWIALLVAHHARDDFWALALVWDTLANVRHSSKDSNVPDPDSDRINAAAARHQLA